MREIKFRYVWKYKVTGNIRSDVLTIEKIEATRWPARLMEEYDLIARDQFTGITDKNGKEYYHGDRARFSNGDTFEIKCEDWLEFYVEWIGEPECEDQARDIYRIENAEVIGNIHE